MLEIAASLAQGQTFYAIAMRVGESLASIRNLNAWFGRAGDTVQVLARGAGHLDPLTPGPTPTTSLAMLALFRMWPSWQKFTHSLSRAFYLARFPVSPTHTILTG